MRSLEELVNVAEPGITLVREWLEGAVRPAVLLPCDPAVGAQTLLGLQVTTRSPMGAMAFETGGLLVDDGWLRILGAPSERLPRGLLSIFPFPFAKGPPIAERSRRAVPVAELWTLYAVDLPAQLSKPS